MASENASKIMAASIVDSMDADALGDEDMLEMEDDVEEGEIAVAEDMMEAINAQDPAAFARAMKSFLSFV